MTDENNPLTQPEKKSKNKRRKKAKKVIRKNPINLTAKPLDSDLKALETSLFSEAPKALAQGYILAKVIHDNRILENENVDSSVITNLIKNIGKDSEILSEELTNIQENYQKAREEYNKKGMEVDVHIRTIGIAHDTNDWMEKYTNTILTTIEDVHDYLETVNVKTKQSENINDQNNSVTTEEKPND